MAETYLGVVDARMKNGTWLAPAPVQVLVGQPASVTVIIRHYLIVIV